MELNTRDLMKFSGLGLLVGMLGEVRSTLAVDITKIPKQRDFVAP